MRAPATDTRHSHKPRPIVYIINVDWFFVSHFLHLAKAAQRDGHEVFVASHFGPARTRLEQDQCHIVALPETRTLSLPSALSSSIATVGRTLTKLEDPIVHGFGQFGTITGAMAARRAGIKRQVYSVTGRGYSAASNHPHVRLLRHGLRAVYRHTVDGPDVWWTAENRKDLSGAGLARARREGRTHLVGGAGVNPTHYVPTAMPTYPPLKLGLVSRLIWSKGVDVAAEAVGRARAAGVNVTLSIAGPLDPEGRRSLSKSDITRLAAIDGVSWLGRVDDIPAFWRHHHAAILPSRGGEGIPRALIEAAACGRPVITSDVPGCAEFADATQGWSVQKDDVAALAGCIAAVAQANDLDFRGATARRVAERDYSETAVWSIIRRLYDRTPTETAGLLEPGRSDV